MCNENRFLQSRLDRLENELSALKYSLAQVTNAGVSYPSGYGCGYPDGNSFGVRAADTDTLELQVGRLLLIACQKGIRYTQVRIRDCDRVTGVISLRNPNNPFWADLMRLSGLPDVSVVKMHPAALIYDHAIRVFVPGGNDVVLHFIPDGEHEQPEAVMKGEDWVVASGLKAELAAFMNDKRLQFVEIKLATNTRSVGAIPAQSPEALKTVCSCIAGAFDSHTSKETKSVQKNVSYRFYKPTETIIVESANEPILFIKLEYSDNE